MLDSNDICVVFGSVFVSVLGIFANPLVSAVGIFETNGIHNLVHVLTGTPFLFGGFARQGACHAPSRDHRVFWRRAVGVCPRRQYAPGFGAHQRS